jgi:hypothetical protein
MLTVPPAGVTVAHTAGTKFGSIQADMNDWASLVYPIGAMKIYYTAGQFPTNLSSGGGASQAAAAAALGIPCYVCYQPAFSGTTNDPTWPGGPNKPAQGDSVTPGTILGDSAALIASVTGLQAAGLIVAGVVLHQEGDGTSHGISGDQFTYLYYQNYAPFKAAHPDVQMICIYTASQAGVFHAMQAYFPGPTPSTAPNGFTATAAAGGGTFTMGTRWYQIAGIDSSGRVLTSNEASAAIAAGGSAQLAWTNPGGLSSVQVWRGTARGGENTLVATLPANATAYTDTGIAGAAGTLVKSLYTDGIGLDIYGDSAVNSSNVWIRPAYSGAPLTTPNWGDIADFQTPPVAFGWTEAGNSVGASSMTQVRMSAYLSSDPSIGGDPVNSIQAVYAQRIAAGKPVIPFMWYQNDSNSTGPNLIVSTSLPDYRIGLLQSLAATMSSTPAIADTAGATDRLSVVFPPFFLQVADRVAATDALNTLGSLPDHVAIFTDAGSSADVFAYADTEHLAEAEWAAALDGLAVLRSGGGLWTLTASQPGTPTTITVPVSQVANANVLVGQNFQLHAAGGALLQPQIFTITSTGQ